MRKGFVVVALIGLTLALAGCGGAAGTPQATPPSGEAALTPVTFMLDWVPNTNHTGIFVAQQKGYFEEAGLAVNIVQPGEVYAEQAVASGAADFGISFQEQITLARADGVPLVSIAAIIQHNTSGFASRAELGSQLAERVGRMRYGSYGSPLRAYSARPDEL